MDFVVLGCLCIDNVVNSDGVKRLRQFGGNCAYGAAGMHLWESGSIGIVSRIGYDFPREWVKQLEGTGIDTEGIREVNKRHMMYSGMLYDARGDRKELTFSEDPEADGDDVIVGFPVMTPEMVTQAHEDFAPLASDSPSRYDDANYIMIASRHYDRQLAYAKYFRKANPGCHIVMDLGQDYLHPSWKERIVELFSLVDIVVPSEDEVKRLMGRDFDDMELAARLLCSEYGANNACVKVGRDGSIVYEKDKDRITRVGICKVDAKDPTGAGDSFCGGFTVGLKETGSFVEAAKYGAVSSSFIIENFGVEESLRITRSQAVERLRTIGG